MKRTSKQKKAVARFEADIRDGVRRSRSFGISALNYGLDADDKLLMELRQRFPGLSISAHGFLGYVHFEVKS